MRVLFALGLLLSHALFVDTSAYAVTTGNPTLSSKLFLVSQVFSQNSADHFVKDRPTDGPSSAGHFFCESCLSFDLAISYKYLKSLAAEEFFPKEKIFIFFCSLLL